MAKEDAGHISKKLYEIRSTYTTHESAMSLYKKEVIEKFKAQYPILMIKSKLYELNQIFNLKFYKEEN